MIFTMLLTGQWARADGAADRQPDYIHTYCSLGDSHPHLHLVPDAHQRLLEGSARTQSSLHTTTDLPGPYCVILPTIVDTFFGRQIRDAT